MSTAFTPCRGNCGSSGLPCTMLTLCRRLCNVLSHKNTNGNLRMSSASATVLPNGRRELEGEVTRTAPQIDNYVSGPQIQCLDNIGWPLPLVSLSLDDVQTRKSIQTLVSGIENEQDCDPT